MSSTDTSLPNPSLFSVDFPERLTSVTTCGRTCRCLPCLEYYSCRAERKTLSSTRLRTERKTLSDELTALRSEHKSLDHPGLVWHNAINPPIRYLHSIDGYECTCIYDGYDEDTEETQEDLCKGHRIYKRRCKIEERCSEISARVVVIDELIVTLGTTESDQDVLSNDAPRKLSRVT